MPNTPRTSQTSRSETVVHILAVVGVTFWVAMIVAALAGKLTYSTPRVIGLGIILLAAHALISVNTRRQKPLAIALMWFVLVADAVLALLINPKAWLLVGASIILLIAGYSCRRSWSTSPATANH